MEIYCDGSCKMSTRDGGWAYALIQNDEVVYEEWGSEKFTTNNVMELTALKKALTIGKMHALAETDLEVVIYTDSQYCSKGYNEWCSGWEKKNWKTSTNKKVENLEIWQIIHRLRHPRVKVKWVKGHDGNKWNEYVDGLTRNYE